MPSSYGPLSSADYPPAGQANSQAIFIFFDKIANEPDLIWGISFLFLNLPEIGLWREVFKIYIRYFE
jgi:hypothetical protein